MPTWPGTLPQDLLVDGYEEQFPDGKVRTSMETGPSKQRRRFTAAERPITASQQMTRAQIEILLGFFRDDLGMGALAFDWIDQRTQNAVSIRFVERPRVSPLPGSQLWNASFNLEILP